MIKNQLLLDAFSLEGKRVLVTGASSGIGRETAILLSTLNADLILLARDAERLAETKKALHGEQHHVYSYDLTELNGIGDLIEQIVHDTGPLYGLVHCAGLQQIMPLRGVELQDARALFDVNVLSAMMLIKGFRKKQRHTEDSRIALIASILGLVGAAGRSTYSASKGAVIGLVKSLALELAGEGIKVNSISPGFVQTAMLDDLSKKLNLQQQEQIAEMHPLGLGHAKDVAWAVCYLLGKTGSWITGTNLVVDGGYTAH